MPKIWSVTELTMEIARALSSRNEFYNCWVSGELSNFKNHRPSGHWYFTLKDEASSLKGVMFRARAEQVKFLPADGLKVLVRGNIRLYERDGNVQLYAEEMQPSGLGELYLAFEQLKQKLAAEGLFDPLRKKKIPGLPRRVGLVTSPTGAVLRDILTIMHRRHAKMSWILAPAAVQGEAAPREIAQGIRRLNQYGKVDVVIVGRGGGSLEELWAFNTEIVARAIAESRIPVISAVGHETDYTIADYVADLRAPTPSAAAELAVPVLAELQTTLNLLAMRLELGMRSQLEGKRHTVEGLAGRGPLSDPFWRLEKNRQSLDMLANRLTENTARFITDKNGILKLLATKLDMLSPLSILGRGYSLTYDREGQLISSIQDTQIDDKIQVRLGDGSLHCRVLAKENQV